MLAIRVKLTGWFRFKDTTKIVLVVVRSILWRFCACGYHSFSREFQELRFSCIEGISFKVFYSMHLSDELYDVEILWESGFGFVHKHICLWSLQLFEAFVRPEWTTFTKSKKPDSIWQRVHQGVFKCFSVHQHGIHIVQLLALWPFAYCLITSFSNCISHCRLQKFISSI